MASISHCLLAGILFLAVGTAEGAEWIVEGRVAGVSDGDTITVLDDTKAQHKIRFAESTPPRRAKRSATIETEPIGARIPEAE